MSQYKFIKLWLIVQFLSESGTKGDKIPKKAVTDHNDFYIGDF